MVLGEAQYRSSFARSPTLLWKDDADGKADGDFLDANKLDAR